jgi:hypothetical protein
MANKKPLVMNNGQVEQIQSPDVIDPAFYTGGAGTDIVESLLINATTTIITNTNTNLSFAIAAGETWIVEFMLTVQCSSTGGVKFQISAPTAATIEGWVDGRTSSATTLAAARLTAINTLTATGMVTTGATPMPIKIWVRVKNPTNAGNVSLGFASTTNTQTSTIFLGSTMTAFKTTEV